MMPKLLIQGPAYLFRLAQAIHRLSPEVIYTNGLKSNLLLAHYWFYGPRCMWSGIYG